MENGKKSFILHLDSLCILDEMSFEQKGILFDAIYKFHCGVEVNLDFGMKMAFSPFKNQFIRDNEKYFEFTLKQSVNGQKGGRPKKNQTTPKNPKNPTLSEKAYNDNVNDNVNENDKVRVNDNIIPEIENFGNDDIDYNFQFSDILKNNSQSWLESVSMQEKIPIEDIKNKIDDFVLFLKTTTTQHKNKKAFITHFVNWLPKQKNKNNNGKQQYKFDVDEIIKAESGSTYRKQQFRFNTAEAISSLVTNRPPD